MSNKPTAYVRSFVWKSNNGKSASIYGAVPYYNQEQKVREGWEVVPTGWLPQWKDGTVGAGRRPHATEEECRAFYESPRE